MLRLLLSTQGSDALRQLEIRDCEEPSFTFEGVPHLSSSLEHLLFSNCKIQSLPTNLSSLPSLKSIGIYSCSNISSLPDLPKSLERISIYGCPVLKERCPAPHGEDWPISPDLWDIATVKLQSSPFLLKICFIQLALRRGRRCSVFHNARKAHKFTLLLVKNRAICSHDPTV